MNQYLIDTHIFLWLLFDPAKISHKKIQVLKDPKNKIYIASITFWEISLKYNLGKLELNGFIPDELPSLAYKMGLEMLEVDTNTMATFYKLQKVDNHKDPFDRIIIWKCINDNITLISQDKKFFRYEPFGLQTL